MGAPARRQREVQIGGTLVRSGSHEKFRPLADKVLANRPKPRKGASIVRELKRLRLRGGPLR